MGNKPNAMLAKIEAKYKELYEQKLALAHANYRKMLDIALQYSADAALMAADDTFDVNAYSAEKFHTAHITYVNQIAKQIIDDAKDDPKIVFTRADVDRRLLQIVGEKNFVPWDERYAGRMDHEDE